MEAKQDIRMLVSATPCRYGMDQLDIVATFVSYGEAGEIRNLDSGGSYDLHPLGFLQVRAMADMAAAFGDSYGWTVDYRDVYSIDLQRAEMMAKQLRKIGKGMDKLTAQLTYPGDFPSFLARVASVVGVSMFGFKRSGNDSSYDGNEYRWTDAAGMAYRVNQSIADYRKVSA
jgi:hypothetical protein